MSEYLELALAGGLKLRPLEGDRVTIGRTAGNDVVLGDDDNVSRIHAVLKRVGPGWCLEDLGSRNGTFVNRSRVAGSRTLQDGDEVRIGTTRAVFRASGPVVDESVTVSHGPAPSLTRREQEVIVALCRPLFSGDVLGVPAPVRVIAAELGVGEDAVKQHLTNLFHKFDVPPAKEGGGRNGLAREAMLRGAVSRADFEGRTSRVMRS
jgi:pSer/pThr/pTyr-binding forkhead associated (FHA) protein